MDNHLVHKNLNSLKFYKEKGVNAIEFFSYSHDLNLIKNIWVNKEADYEKNIRLWMY